MNINELTSINEEEFWRQADELQQQTIDHASSLFNFTETATPEQLISLLIQYRYFTIYYIPDLAILVARLPDGRLRSFLADILSDELGYGDPEKAHPHLYDDFLRSIGVSDEKLDSVALRDNIVLLEKVRRDLMDPGKSSAFGIGLRGMGGECVCQIYLARFYNHIIKNPYIKSQKNKIDWRFWDLHVGDHDIEHRVKTRQLIHEEIVRRDPVALAELNQGYHESMSSWRQFWDNIFVSATHKEVARAQVQRVAQFQVPDVVYA